MTRKALFALIGLKIGTPVINDAPSVGWLVQQRYVVKTTDGRHVVTPRGSQAIERAQQSAIQENVPSGACASSV